MVEVARNTVVVDVDDDAAVADVGAAGEGHSAFAAAGAFAAADTCEVEARTAPVPGAPVPGNPGYTHTLVVVGAAAYCYCNPWARGVLPYPSHPLDSFPDSFPYCAHYAHYYYVLDYT